MTWVAHKFGRDPALDEIVMRRFGRNHDKPCRRPSMLTCAQWECQHANECQSQEPQT